jgi:hypothetical protein
MTMPTFLTSFDATSFADTLSVAGSQLETRHNHATMSRIIFAVKSKI